MARGSGARSVPGRGVRLGLGLTSALAGAFLIAGAWGRWRDLSDVGMDRLYLAGIGLRGHPDLTTTHPLGWVLVGCGVVTLCSILFALYRPVVTAVVTTVAGTAALIVVAIGGWYRPWGVVGESSPQLGAEGDAVEGFFAELSPGWGLILTTVGAVLAVVAGIAGLVVTGGRGRPLLLIVPVALGAMGGVLAIALGAWSPDDTEQIDIQGSGLSVTDSSLVHPGW